MISSLIWLMQTAIHRPAGGFTDRIADHKLKVEFPEKSAGKAYSGGEKGSVLLAVLADDPRPGYQKECRKRIWNVLWKYGTSILRYRGKILVVFAVENLPKKPE